MAFDDGTPIDAAKLAALETKLATLGAQIPQIGSATTTSNVANNATVTPATVAKEIYGGITDTVKLTPGSHTEFDIPYQTKSVPTAVILTPVHGFNSKGVYNHNAYVYSVTATGAKGSVYYASGSTSGASTRFYFMVICG